MSDFYGPRDDAESLATIGAALDAGCRVLDTADMYGPFTNEQLIGKAIAGRRDQVVLATKFGNERRPDGSFVGVNGKPDYVRAACDASLQRLGVGTIVLTAEDLQALGELAPVGAAAGARYANMGTIDV